MQTISFQIDTDAAPSCTVEAAVTGGHAEITRVTDEAGNDVHTTPDDLDRFEAHLFPEETAVEATDPVTGERRTYAVRHDGDRVGPIATTGGYRVRRNSELYTEVAEAFHIDRTWRQVEESDVQGYARRC